MASYKAHISFGAIAGVILAVLTVLYFAIPSYSLLIFIFGSAVIGSFLPDLDSDSGIPFQVVFGLFGLLMSGLGLYMTLDLYPEEYMIACTVAIVLFVFSRFMLGWVFKKFTHHRGIFHSIPAAGIAMFLMLILLNYFELEFVEKFFISVSLGIGFLVHLILDEVYAGINLNGKRFRPNKALGSALKLWSGSWFVSLMAYIILLVTAYIGLMGI